MAYFSYLDKESGIAELIARHAKRYLPISTFTHDVMRGPSPLSVAQRELLGAFISRLNECNYCSMSHTTQTTLAGIPEETVDAIVEDIDTAPFDEAFKPILKFVEKLTMEPENVNEDDVASIYAAGWGEEALEDVIFVTCIFNFYNRWLQGHGVHGTREKVEQMAPLLQKQGYLAYNQKMVERLEGKKK